MVQMMKVEGLDAVGFRQFTFCIIFATICHNRYSQLLALEKKWVGFERNNHVMNSFIESQQVSTHAVPRWTLRVCVCVHDVYRCAGTALHW